VATSAVRKLTFDADRTEVHGPLLVDQRTRGSGLNELGAGFVDFPDGGTSSPWTTPYEEVIYVVAGKFMLTADGDTLVGRPGDLITIAKGTTVTYGGEAGTRVLFSLVPADWAERMPA
jgi:ethanolamine utilization protein EutQ (cupin superfamily)